MKDEARDLVACIYGQEKVDSLNVLHVREHVFANNKGDIRNLPPTEYSFYFHLLCALYQFSIYKQLQAVNPHINLPDPCTFGRVIQNWRLIP